MDTKNLKKLRIYIVDDHKLFREGLKLLLSTQDFVHHIYEASNGRDFIENLSFVDCDLVLMDIEMPEMNGIEATEQALRIRPDLKVIVLSMYGDEQYYYKMVDVGVKGFVLKNSGIEKVIAAIRAVAAGENYFSEELLVNILNNMRDGGQHKPEPETPVMQVNRPTGSVSVTSFRLLPRAPVSFSTFSGFAGTRFFGTSILRLPLMYCPVNDSGTAIIASSGPSATTSPP